MQCPKCGADTHETAEFCSNCGEKLKREPVATDANREETQNINNSPVYQTNAESNITSGAAPMFQNNYGGAYTQYGDTLSPYPAVNAVKKAGSSTLFLVGAILYTISILFSVIGSFAFNNSFDYIELMETVGLWDQLQGVEGYNDFFRDYVNSDYFNNSVRSTTVTSSVFNSIPSILIAIGLWMFYAACRNKQNPSVSTSGLTMIKVLNWISLVILILVFVLVIIFSFIFIAASGELGAGMAGIVALVVALFSLLVLALPVFYYVFLIRTINNIKGIIRTGVPSVKVSVFVAVINFIIAGFSILSSLFVFNAFLFISTVCSSAFLIIMGVGIFNFKNTMSIETGSYNAHNNPQQFQYPQN